MSLLSQRDPEIAASIADERVRQVETLEMIASENYASAAVLEATGSVFTNKYAEGYPGKRYYAGNQHSDRLENAAIDRAKALFGLPHVNVQPSSGAEANMAAYFATIQPGDTVMGLNLDQGGHLTHGSPVNFSGRLYNFVPYSVDRESEALDLAEIRQQAVECKPKLIVAGYTAYPRKIDFAGFKEIAREVGALLMVDMSHIAGLISAGALMAPTGYAVTVTPRRRWSRRASTTPASRIARRLARFAAAMPNSAATALNHRASCESHDARIRSSRSGAASSAGAFTPVAPFPGIPAPGARNR